MLLVREDAEDVAQQVFIKAWKAWSSFEGNRTQRVAWLLKITRNASVDAARKRNVRRMAPLDVVLEERTAQVLSSPDFDGDVIWPVDTRRFPLCHPDNVGCFKPDTSMAVLCGLGQRDAQIRRGIEGFLSPCPQEN